MKESSKKIRVLMLGTDKSTGGGMWTVAKNYIESNLYQKDISLKYIPTFVVGNKVKKILFALLAYIKILFYLVIHKPQIVHVHMAEKGSVYRKGIAIKMACFFGCKIIIHMHGAEFQVWYESLEPEKKNKVKKILNRADKVIILGEYWKSFLSQLVPENKIAVIYNAVEVPKENKYNNNANRILFLGVVGQRKGAYDLLEAYSRVKDKIQGFELEFYGPDFEGKISDEIEKLNLQDRVRYMGWLGSSDKELVFKDVVCNVLPSYNEGLPMTILETMAYGIPNISTTVAAIPEVINNQNGFLVEAGNIEEISKSIEKICKEEKVRKILSQNAYQTIKNQFSIKKHVEEIINLYRELLCVEKQNLGN